MIKFILHGGVTSVANNANKEFFREIVKGLADGAVVLLIYFSRPAEEWSKLFQQDKDIMTAVADGKVLQFVVATKHDFADQLRTAGAVYLRGGSTDNLLASLKKCQDFKILIQGKVVAGSSAGAYALATKYYSNSKAALLDGLGILPIKIVCHYAGSQEILAVLKVTVKI